MPSVELHPAFHWSCPACGRLNYAHAVVPESLEGQLLDDFDLEVYSGVQWLMKPTRVECEHCGAEFDVEEDEAAA